jgi:tetratricopeptide (TPR) repeat protein
VATLLQGSVRKAGDRLRITTQLIQVADDRCVWSERYDRRMRDVFAIQEDIAQSIVQSLRGALRPEEAAVLPRTATSHVAAYDHYLRGRSHFYKGSRKDHELAQRMFSRAIEIDPEFSRAHAGLADSLAYTYKHFERSDKILAEADVASARALELDPDSAEAHAARGVVHWMRERHADADREFETAIRLDPRLFEAYFHFALSCFNRGMPKRSVELLERAEEIRPEDYQPPLIAATLHQGLGRKEKAEAAFRRGLAMVERHLDLVPDDVRALYLGAQALVFLGETERGLEWADRARDMDPDNSLVLLNVAEARSLAGRADEALDALERAIDLGYGHRGTLLHDPCLAPIRNHPRFRRLVDRMT